MRILRVSCYFFKRNNKSRRYSVSLSPPAAIKIKIMIQRALKPLTEFSMNIKDSPIVLLQTCFPFVSDTASETCYSVGCFIIDVSEFFKDANNICSVAERWKFFRNNRSVTQMFSLKKKKKNGCRKEQKNKKNTVIMLWLCSRRTHPGTTFWRRVVNFKHELFSD